MTNHCIRKFKQFIKRLDAFSIPTKVKLYDNEEFSSITGGILTIILSILLIYRTISLIYSMLIMENFDYIITNDSSFNEPMNLTNYTITICPNSYNNPYLFNYSEVININNNSNAKIQPYTCIFSSFNIPCTCYDLSNHSITDSLSILNSTKSQFNIAVNETEYDLIINGNSNYSLLEDNTLDICIFYNQSFVSPSHYYEPIKQRMKVHCFNVLNINDYKMEFVFDKVKIQRDNAVTHFLMGRKDINTESLVINEIKSESNLLTLSSKRGKITVVFSHSGWCKTYIFNGFDIDKLFSVLGGYYELLIWLFTLLGNFINENIMRKYIRKKIVLDVEEKIIEEFQRFKKTKEIIEDLEQINKEKAPINLNNAFSINNSSDKITFEKVKSNIIGNFQSINLSHSSHQGDISSAYSKNYSHRFDNVSIKSKNKFNALKQFEKYLDLSCIYKLVKEVKLLELMCLKRENGFLFYNCLDGEININLLESTTKEYLLKDIFDLNKKETFNEKMKIIMNCLVINKKLETLNSKIQSK